MQKPSFFHEHRFSHRYSNMEKKYTANRLPDLSQTLKFAQRERKVSDTLLSMPLKRKNSQTIQEQLKQFTSSLNHRYLLSPKKCFAFEDSLCAYSHFLTNPNIETKDIVTVLNYMYDRYIFREYPEAMGCIIGQLLIHRLINPSDREQVSGTIDMIYDLTKKDRSFCDMSKIMHLVLMDIWQRWAHERLGWEDYSGWNESKGKQETFWKLTQATKDDFRAIWIEFQLNDPRHQHQVIEILRRLMDFKKFTSYNKVINLFMFIFLLNFLIDQHKNVHPFSDELFKTLNQIISKLCYLPLNHLFRHMNAFLILYKMVAKERGLFGQVILKLHLALRASPIFLKRSTEMSRHYLDEFKQMVNQDVEYTQYYDMLDKELEHVVVLNKIVESPTQFFSFGGLSQSQKKSQKINYSYENVFKTLNSQSPKIQQPPSENRICRSILQAKPEILKYAEQKIFNLEYIELYLTLDRIHQAFSSRLVHMCDIETNIEQRHNHVKYLYTWFCAAYLKIMKNIQSEENTLFWEGFMPKGFLQQMHSELISRMAELGIVEIDWKKVYSILFEEYCIEDTIIFDFTDSNFAVKSIFDTVQRMGFNVGNPASYYELLKLRNYLNTFVSKPNNGPYKDPKRQQLHQQMRRTVERILNRMKLMISRPQTKLVKTQQAQEKKSQSFPQKASHAYHFQEQLRYPLNFDNTYHFIKTTIFRMVQMMEYYGERVPQDYKDLFLCLVIVLDNEKLLLDIYGNLWFRILGSGNQRLVDWGYNNLNILRKALTKKQDQEHQQTKSLIHGMLCVYERLRKIEIHTERQKTKKSSSTTFVDKSSGKSKIYLAKDEQQPQPESKIYQTYFERLFECPLQQILDFGKQLAGMKKYRQAIYVLQRINDRLKEGRNRFKLGIWDGQVDVKQMEIKSIECDIVLCHCYAVLVTPFKDVLGTIKKVCIEEKIAKLRSEYSRENFDYIMAKLQQAKPPPLLHQTLITKVTRIVKQQYHKNHRYFNLRQLIMERDAIRLRQEDLHMEFQVYCEITNYSMCELGSIKTRDDFKMYYRNILAAALIVKWYEERKAQMVERAKIAWNKGQVERNDYQFDQQEKSQILMPPNAQQTQKRKSTYNLRNEGQAIYQSFSEIVKDILPQLPSPRDRLTIVETLFYYEQLDNLKRFETMRLHNQALLEAGQIQRILDMCEVSYNGENYELMTLIDLEILQRYYFEKGSYQHVKLIAKIMLNEREQQLYSQHFSCFVCWPQVFYYDLHAKIYDDNLSSDIVVTKRWEEFLKLIKHDNVIIVDNSKQSLDLLSDPNYLKQLQMKQPVRLAKVKKQLSEKIRQYFKLLRIIFDNLQLKSKIAVNIFLILQKIFQKFFIPNLTPSSLYIDFFFYYLRFLCEGINCQRLEIENEARFYNGLQKVAADIKYQNGVQAKQMDLQYMIERTGNIVALMMSNIQWIKHHFMYLTKAFDEQQNSKKNFIIKKLLVEIVCKNPPEQIWNLAFLKYYNLKFPYQAVQGRQSVARKNKFQQRSNFNYDQDTLINIRHDDPIKDVYDEILGKLGDTKINSLLEIPELLIEVLEFNACEKAMRCRQFSYDADDRMKQRVKDINTKIKQSQWRIPYPLDPNFYIKSLNKFQILGNGKSVPTNFQFYCRPYSQTKGDIYRNEKNSQMTINDSLKFFIMKYNFSREDYTVETATANFYNELGMLDKEITYKIVNLTKYLLIIQKIGVKHCTMFELIDNACGIKGLDREAIQHAMVNDTRCDKKQVNQARQFYDLTRVQKFNPIDENRNKLSLFKSFYNQGLQKRTNIEEWWKYMDNFVRTLGQWSYLCYLTKLGDRHNQNILVTEAGKLIHIDYEYNFAQGLNLPCPEWVPIRLTQAFVSVMGTFKERGTFFSYFLEMAKKFDPLEEQTWKALGNFQPEQRQIISSSANFSRLRKGLSIEEAIENIIDTSRSDSLLRMMYIGWLSVV